MFNSNQYFNRRVSGGWGFGESAAMAQASNARSNLLTEIWRTADKCRIPDRYLTEFEIKEILIKCTFRRAMADIEFREGE